MRSKSVPRSSTSSTGVSLPAPGTHHLVDHPPVLLRRGVIRGHHRLRALAHAAEDLHVLLFLARELALLVGLLEGLAAGHVEVDLVQAEDDADALLVGHLR